MKKIVLLIILILSAVTFYWVKHQRELHDPHYDAAVCVAIEMLGMPTSEQDFVGKVRTVIINENNSYSLKKVRFNERLSKSSIDKYENLDPEQKRKASEGLDSCLAIMAGTH